MNLRTFAHIDTLEEKLYIQMKINQIVLTVPERISCGQQLNRNGRQTRRSSNDILDLVEPVTCVSNQNRISYVDIWFFVKIKEIKSNDLILTQSPRIRTLTAMEESYYRIRRLYQKKYIRSINMKISSLDISSMLQIIYFTHTEEPLLDYFYVNTHDI